MHIADMEVLVRDIFPNCTFAEDTDGEIVIYTNMMVDGKMIVPFEEA